MSAHVDDDTFERLAMQELDEPARRDALAHVHACRRCAAIYKVLLGVEEGARSAGLLPAPRRARWPWLAGGLVAMAAAALVVFWLVRPPPPATVRGADPREVLLVGPSGEVRGPVELRWELTPSTAYRVDVYTHEGRLAWSKTTPRPPLAWPHDVEATPGDYQWMVTALDGNVAVARSAVGSFRILP